MEKSEFGVAGLGVMGSNIALNLADKGVKVSVFNRLSKGKKNAVEAFLGGEGGDKKISGFTNLKDFAQSLESPRKILLMVKAGEAVDEILEGLMPFLSCGDIVIDGGNSNFKDTARRLAELEGSGILFVGAGISGGEEGARNGASIMPGGNEKAWAEIKPYLQKIAAKLPNGDPCCEWIGGGASGHFVKTIHNGIEYADMQMIAEIYQVMRKSGKFSNVEMADVFEKFNRGKLESFLIEITAKILRRKDESGRFSLDLILDAAGQKGTGKWSVESGAELGSPVSCIAEALFARFVSGRVEMRKSGSRIFGSKCKFNMPRDVMGAVLENALYAAKIIAYAQGFSILSDASKKFGWNLNLGEIAKIWRGGCIIRAKFLDRVTEAFSADGSLENLLFDGFFAEEIRASVNSLREVASLAAQGGVSMPASFSALAYFDSARQAESPSNLIQAQRDFFGAHTYERMDAPRGEFFHTKWE